MDVLTHLGSGLLIALSPINLMYTFIGTVIGTAIGVLPGLGPPATVALLLPITYKINPASGVMMLAGIYYGAMYGGSTTSILLNIPGEATSVVTCLDGYQMARQGRAGPALGISAIGSFFAGTVSLVGLTLVAPPMASFAIKFGYAEYSSLVVLGLVMAIYLSEGSVLKGLMMSAFGLLLGTIGLDPIFGVERFTFGVSPLADGIDFIVAAMGLFGIAEVLCNLENPEIRDVFKTSLKHVLPTREDWRQSWGPMMRGSVIGFFIGALPGGGGIISSFISYAVEKRISNHPERFRQGGHRRSGCAGVGKQRLVHLIVHSAADPGDSRDGHHSHDLRGAFDSRDTARPAVAAGAPESVLGCPGIHVYRKRDAAGAEPSSDRCMGASS